MERKKGKRVGNGREGMHEDGENVHKVHANLSAKRPRGCRRNVQNASAKRPQPEFHVNSDARHARLNA